MKLKTVLDNIVKSEETKEWLYIPDFARKRVNIELDYLDTDSIPERLTCYFFANWICTDTMVGGRAYYLDDVLVCASWQPARKSDEDMYWVSQDAYFKVRDYMLELKALEEIDIPKVPLIDMDEHFGIGFELSYSTQVTHDKVWYLTSLIDEQGVAAQVVRRFDHNSELTEQDLIDISVKNQERIFASKYIRIKRLDTGAVFCTPMKRIRLPYNVEHALEVVK